MNNLQSFLPSNFESLFMFGTGTTAAIFLVFILAIIVPMCLIFKKAGREWWEAIVPFYNLYVLTIIIGQPWWLLIGFFIPFVSWIVSIYFSYHLSKRFGFDVPFTIGLVILPFIFLPILAFGSALYTQPEIKE